MALPNPLEAIVAFVADAARKSGVPVNIKALIRAKTSLPPPPDRVIDAAIAALEAPSLVTAIRVAGIATVVTVTAKGAQGTIDDVIQQVRAADVATKETVTQAALGQKGE